jgi:hypothetical protein
VQATIGGQCVFVMLRAMWPSINNIREWMATGHILYSLTNSSRRS